MVLYRKYRPQKIEELDLESVRHRLRQVLSSSYLPHAYLFAGPKGTGKTSAARIVAKVLNCEQSPVFSNQLSVTSKKKLKTENRLLTTDIEPCNNCDTCRSITSGSHIDILEIDAASNRGIDEIRNLREGIKLSPVSARQKVYIIDEVHMLTNEAFNALLKTLEEPPSHAVFILATTEAGRLPETIISRTTRFDFRMGKDSEISRCLERIVKGEKVKIDGSSLDLIAKSADGSFRDATKLLEQAISQEALSYDMLVKLLGQDRISIVSFLKLLKEGETKLVLAEIEKMAGTGVDFSLFTKEVLNILHTVLLAQHGIKEKDIGEDFDKMLTIDEVKSLIGLFSKVYTELKGSSLPQLPLELAVVEWTSDRRKA